MCWNGALITVLNDIEMCDIWSFEHHDSITDIQHVWIQLMHKKIMWILVPFLPFSAFKLHPYFFFLQGGLLPFHLTIFIEKINEIIYEKYSEKLKSKWTCKLWFVCCRSDMKRRQWVEGLNPWILKSENNCIWILDLTLAQWPVLV